MSAAPPTLFDFLGEEVSNAEERAAFHMRLRARGIQDLAVLRTLELVPRALFVPHRYADLAQKDVSLPIGCGQTISEPGLVAQMMEALDLAKHHRVLEVGAGTGYTAAILAQLAGEVISLERFQSLATEARSRLGQMGIDNAGVVWGDGLSIPPEVGAFDRIFVEGRLDAGPEAFIPLLEDGGILVFAQQDPEAPVRQQLVKLMRSGSEAEMTCIAPCRMQAILPGLARAL
ncbi:protein-L-isoaspartate O-methyltransferase family protein [Methyloferula stellata]|uniref:protein-L-isoaspartate O-methyltransferase family protein n=1 Tax=Methyloferula stellata TaxID=876270 RepID=UPI0003687722|nr:methyltransferase domain-containing protein [Methyloferula stellata]